MAARIHHIGITVPDLQQAAKFFYEVFGVGTAKVESEKVKNLYVQFENLSVQICEDPARLGSAPFGRLDHIAIHVDDLDDTSKRLQEQGVAMVWKVPVKVDKWRNNFTSDDGGVGVQFQLADELAHEREGQEFRPGMMDAVAEAQTQNK
jgi:predicted enzyme related to lactoylglutathione lyase